MEVLDPARGPSQGLGQGKVVAMVFPASRSSEVLLIPDSTFQRLFREGDPRTVSPSSREEAVPALPVISAYSDGTRRSTRFTFPWQMPGAGLIGPCSTLSPAACLPKMGCSRHHLLKRKLQQ